MQASTAVSTNTTTEPNSTTAKPDALSDIEWRILQRRIHRQSNAIIEEFAALRISAEHYLSETNCDTSKLVTCIMDVRHIKAVSKESPLLDLESATSVSRVFFCLIKRNLISFLQFSIIKRVITTLCSDCARLQEELRTYETHFNQYIKRRVCESSIYHEGRFELFTGTDSEDKVELLIITDENWDDYIPFVKLLDLEDIVAKCLNIDRFVIHLASIEPHCLRIRYTISVHNVNSVFPLTSEEWSELTQHGIVEMKCLMFHYTQEKKCKSTSIP